MMWLKVLTLKIWIFFKNKNNFSFGQYPNLYAYFSGWLVMDGFAYKYLVVPEVYFLINFFKASFIITK